jgi:hypothetical protein
MNRTLKRPMFRIGGSVNSGITSGLDTPKRGLVDGPGKYSQTMPTMAELVTQTRESITPEVMEAYKPYFERPKGEGFNRFLINTGLNLMSATPKGKGLTGLLATAGEAAKEPTAKLFEDIDTQRLSKKAAEADLFKTLLEGNIGIAESAAEGTGDAVAKRGVKLQIADDIETTMDLILKLENKQSKTPDQFSEDDSNLLNKKKLRLEQLTKNDTVMQSLLGDEQYTQRIMRKIKDNLLNKKNANGADFYKGDDDPKLLEDMFLYYNQFFKTGKFPDVNQPLAEGGRAGYQMGGGADMAQAPMSMPQEPMSMDQEPKIDFGTLRARLPQEIGDDVVRLIAASPEALEDFATIATQQDVDLFNQKYSVNLVLPQEA